jgi:hypothetical protein
VARRGILLLALLLPGVAVGETWYVRPDGGSAEQCSGQVDAPRADGSRDCAWSHPFVALPPGGTARIAGGDTLRILPGSYRMGLGAPDSAHCSRDFPWDCHMPPPPSGSARQPTRIVGGRGGDACTEPPELWGAERAARIIDLSGATHVVLRCLEVTDHAACVEHHCHAGGCDGEVAACPREAPPFGDWAGTGIYARDASNVRITDVNVHGLAVRGFHVGGARDWTLERVRIAGNGWAGWDGDLGKGSSANAGTLRFEDVEIAWNGCAERWPGDEPFGCWAQQAGGYGDGLGTAATGGHWIFDGGSIHHNTSDGLDLLYLAPGGKVDIRGLRAFANAGNQIKASGNARLTSVDVDGDCGFFARDAALSANLREGDHCRALGNAIVAALVPGARFELRDSEVAGTGDCLIVAEGGDASAQVILAHTTLHGSPRFADSSELPCGFYAHQSDARISRVHLTVRDTR